MNEQQIYALTRPHPKLLTLYLIRSVLSGPAIFFTLPLLLFRYHTMHYKFDASGLSMAWGFFFKTQITLSYSRIQDIHLESGIIQRWLGLADIQIQTASGSSEAEATLEGILEFESLRDFLYSKMRGYKDAPKKEESNDEAALLKAIATELAGARAAAEKLAEAKGEVNV